jgi:ABC-type sugar transport system ATPase subunit
MPAAINSANDAAHAKQDASAFVLEMRNITKAFPGILALDGMNLKVRPGTVHVLAGENGAGKSMLMKILSGTCTIDGGEIVFEGESDTEVAMLFRQIADLKSHGVAVIYITHKMDEIFQIADDITVMRDGQFVAAGPASDCDENKLMSQMVGRTISSIFPEEEVPIGDVVPSVEGLSREGVFEDVAFTVRAGEIVGLSGLIGAERTEVARVIFGLDPADAGIIRLSGAPLRLASPSDAISHGIAMVPEDRKAEELVLCRSVGENISLDLSGNHDRAEGMKVTEDWIQSFPQFDAIIAANDRMALGALEALQGADRLKGVMISGVDGVPDALKAIKAGEMSQTIFENAGGQARAAFEVVEGIKKGDQPPAEKLVPFESISKDNVDQYTKK